VSTYQVAKFCRRCLLEPALRQAVQDDPATALGGFDLTDRERELLLDGQVGELYRLGGNAFLLSYLPRWNLFGLDVPTYAQRMRAVRDV
jgi:hypothetical protein